MSLRLKMDEASDLKNQTLHLIADQLGVEKEEINLSDSLEDLVNSEIELSDLITRIENNFHIQFSKDDNIDTVEDLILAVEDKLT